MGDKNGDLIGGPISETEIPATLIDPEDQFLSDSARELLWGIFKEIDKAWENAIEDSAGMKSSWLEFIEAKTTNPPSYVGEYMNAIAVAQELVAIYGRKNAFQRLFFDNGIPDGPPTTKLAHLKKYVIDEFIQVQITASGFRGFASSNYSPNRSLNYKGYLRGSRYNERVAARLYEPESASGQKGKS